MLAMIVRDETRHAALAWRTIAWSSAYDFFCVFCCCISSFFFCFFLSISLKTRIQNQNRQNETIANELRAIVDEEEQHDNSDGFKRLVVPLARALIGNANWRSFVMSSDIDMPAVVDDSLLSLYDSAISTLLKTFSL